MVSAELFLPVCIVYILKASTLKTDKLVRRVVWTRLKAKVSQEEWKVCCRKSSFNPDVTENLREFPENQQNKVQSKVHFHPRLLCEY